MSDSFLFLRVIATQIVDIYRLMPQYGYNLAIVWKPHRKNISMLHLSTGIAVGNKVHATMEWVAVNGIEWGH